MRVSIAVLAACLALHVGTGIRAQETSGSAEPTADEVRAALLADLKPLVFGEDGVERLSLEGVFRPIQQRVSLHARGGDEYDLLIGAIDDAEPFMAGRDGVSLAYTPGGERGKVQLFPGLAQIHLAVEDERLSFGIAMVGPTEEGVGERVIVTLDPRSLLTGVTEDLQVQRGSAGRYRLSGKSPTGTYVEIDVDPDAAYPVTALRATPRTATEPAVAITKLIVNPENGPRTVGIPAAAALSEHFEFEDLRELADTESITKGLAATYSSTGARMRIQAADASHEPSEKAVAMRDLEERRLLGKLIRGAAAND